jgi:hypothetical protein
MALQQQRFEILYEVGCHAILDKYYREAVSCFASALELFYLFYAKVICLKQGIALTEINTAQNEVSRQSERQLGVFIYVYLLEHKKSPSLLPNKLREFRNDVIHRGRFPQREEAITFGQAIANLILPIVKEMREMYHEKMTQAVLFHIYDSSVKSEAADAHGTLGISTIISLSHNVPDCINLEKELEKLSQSRIANPLL